MKRIWCGIIISLITGSVLAAPVDRPSVDVFYGRGHNVAVGLYEKAEKECGNGDFQAARRDLDTIMRGDPSFWLGLYLRARISLQERKWDLTISDCDAGLKQTPTFLEFAILRAVANDAKGRYTPAFAEFDHVIGLHPRRLSALSFALEERAWARINCPDAAFHNPQQAIADAKQACNIVQWKHADAIDVLACAYADAGDFDNATRTEERANGAKDASEMAHELEQHMALFKQHRAIRSVR